MKNAHPPVSLITGASAGIGRALAETLLREGHFVYAGYRNSDRARASYGDLWHVDRLKPVRLDVTRQSEIATVMRAVRAEQGRLDNLINNAGFGVYGAFEELSEQELRAQFETNFFGATSMCRAALPLLRASDRARIINVNSILGQLVLPTGSAYCGSKWALEAFSDCLRYEVRHFGIEVVLVEPGLIRTEFKDRILYSKAAREQNPESLYRHLNRKMAENEYGRLVTSAQAAAGKIADVLRKKRPGPRYRIGVDSQIYYALKRVLPARFIDWTFRLAVWNAWRGEKSKRTLSV